MVAAILAALGTSCSHQKTLSVEDLRSNVTEAISLSAESETFIDYVSQGRATRFYAEGHLEYLLEQASRSAAELHKPVPDSATRPVLSECQNQIDSLVEQLRYVRHELDNPTSLQRAKQQLISVRRTLQSVRGSL
jgi:hypothetical protein